MKTTETGSVKYKCSYIQIGKFLTKIISPLVGHSEYFINNSTDFVHKIGEIETYERDKMVSFDIVSHFTMIPIEAIGILLREHENLKERTNTTPDRICGLVKLCITFTYVESDNNYYE